MMILTFLWPKSDLVGHIRGENKTQVCKMGHESYRMKKVSPNKDFLFIKILHRNSNFSHIFSLIEKDTFQKSEISSILVIDLRLFFKLVLQTRSRIGWRRLSINFIGRTLSWKRTLKASLIACHRRYEEWLLETESRRQVSVVIHEFCLWILFPGFVTR